MRFTPYIQALALIQYKKLRIWFTIAVALLMLTSCSTGTAVAPETIASLVTIQEALKGLRESISKANDAVRERLGQLSAEVDKEIQDIDKLLDEQRNKTLDALDPRINKVFREANDILYQTSESALSLEAIVSEDTNNTLVNAANLLSGIPFVKVQPFIAMSYPTKIIPGSAQPYTIDLLGFFRLDWGIPEAFLPDGSKIQITPQVKNKIRLELPVDYVNSHEGQRVPIVVKYPISNPFIGKKRYDERTVTVTIMPSKILTYKIASAEALPDFVYDYPQVTKEWNREASKCDTNADVKTWSFDDIAGGFDFTSKYDRKNSKIINAVIVQTAGNNPDGQNGSSVSINADGNKVDLFQKARGSCNSGGIFDHRWGEGANRYDRVVITLQLALQRTPVPWELEGGEKEGELTWGNTLNLNPVGKNKLTDLRFEIVDNTYDPPQRRRLSLIDEYNSGIVTVVTTANGVRIDVRSVRRN